MARYINKVKLNGKEILVCGLSPSCGNLLTPTDLLAMWVLLLTRNINLNIIEKLATLPLIFK